MKRTGFGAFTDFRALFIHSRLFTTISSFEAVLETTQGNRIKISIYFRFQTALKLQQCSAPHQHDSAQTSK